ncbi:MAG: hypothetical protein JWQ38_2046 [Flavipsychrobacter sp.]|nr:hypothetical protein [Flavipsychrobacter sp.]
MTGSLYIAGQLKFLNDLYIIMKNISLCLLLCVVNITTLIAQPFRVEKSEAFEESESGWTKILQLKNGNTLLFNAKNKEGFELTIFDKNRKQTVKKIITGKKWDAGELGEARICGLHEINGEAVLFFYEFIKEPVLYRIRINGDNGTVIAEDDLGHYNIPKVGMSYWKYTLGSTPRSCISVDKDPYSDCYAVTFCELVSPLDNPHDVITVKHFNGVHEKLGEARLIPPAGYKYVINVTATVDGDKSVYLLTSATKQAKLDPNYKLFMSKLKPGEKTFSGHIIDPGVDYRKINATMIYAHNDNKIYLMTTYELDREHDGFYGITTLYYSTVLLSIDPETLTMTKKSQIDGKKMVEYAKKHIDEKFDFGGIGQQMVINKDNTIAILTEQNMPKEGALGAVGIDVLSGDGVEQKGYVIDKQQKSKEPDFYTIFNIFKRYNPSYGTTTEHLSYEYVNTEKGSYVFFNDAPENFSRPEHQYECKEMSSFKQSNAVCYKLGDEKTDKSLMFGDPGKDAGAYITMSSSDYNKATGVYATIITESDKKHAKSNIAWITFE